MTIFFADIYDFKRPNDITCSVKTTGELIRYLASRPSKSSHLPQQVFSRFQMHAWRGYHPGSAFSPIFWRQTKFYSSRLFCSFLSIHKNFNRYSVPSYKNSFRINFHAVIFYRPSDSLGSVFAHIKAQEAQAEAQETQVEIRDTIKTWY